MSQAVVGATDLNSALILASPDLIFSIDGNSIDLLSTGENNWFNRSRAGELTLTELFDHDLLRRVQQGIAEAQESADKRAKVEIMIAPDKPQFWGYLGLPKAAIFELTLVSIDHHRTLAAMRNTTELSRLQQAHLRDVMRDPLTGLRSQRALVTVLEKAFGEAKRFDNMRFALLIVDIDHFSDVNDQYGWDAGDQVLRSFAERVSATQRSSDFVCRFGDDIFAILLSEADIGDAVGMGKRLQAIASELAFDFAEEAFNITLSVGASAYIHEKTESVHQLINEAQDNLLIAQTHGGNQVIAAH